MVSKKKKNPIIGIKVGIIPQFEKLCYNVCYDVTS